MLALQRPYNSFEASLTSSKVLTYLEYSYSLVRNLFGKALVLTMVYVLLWPFVLLLGAWLYFQRRYFLSHMNKGHVDFNNPDEYVKFKKRLEKLDKFTPKLEKVGSYNLQNTPPVLSYTLKQMQKTAATLLTYTGWLHLRLNEYNNPKNQTTSSFVFNTEKTLWNNRNSSYSYWM